MLVDRTGDKWTNKYKNLILQPGFLNRAQIQNPQICRHWVTASGKLDAERQCGRRVLEIPAESDKARKEIVYEIKDKLNQIATFGQI
jgi:hypothetical protein